MFTGVIPNSITNMNSLDIMLLFGNSLTGTIPENITQLPNLRKSTKHTLCVYCETACLLLRRS